MSNPQHSVYPEHAPVPPSNTSLVSRSASPTPGMNDIVEQDTFQPPPPERRFFGAAAGGEPFPRDSLISGQSSIDYAGAGGAASSSSVRSLQPEGLPYMDSAQASASPLGGGGEKAYAGKDNDAFAMEDMERKRERVMQRYVTGNRSSRRKRGIITGAIIAILVLLFLVIFLPVYFTVVKKKDSSDVSSPGGSGTGGGGGDSGGDPSAGDGGESNYQGPVTGRDGSVITMADGTNFTYRNTFGGFWVDDPDQPFRNDAQAQSWVPPLNQSWDWSKNRIFGVNLGGWLVLEPFITPSYYEKYRSVDEWTLSQAMAADTANGGLEKILDNHYKTFITEEDFAQIAAAGLSWVRIPIGFWAIETRADEPFLQGLSWQYFLKAIKWARKYGLRIKLDLHTIPGSQNGYNHSGKLGSINFLNGTMGIANAQRALEYIRIFTEFISQPEYKDVVPLFGIMNEALLKTIGKDILSHFYLEAYDIVRGITGYGAGNGPFISIHDGFQGPASWKQYMRGADRLVLDWHPYLCFTTPDPRPLSQQLTKPCQAFASDYNTSLSQFGVTVAGEWSLSFNDCGKWLNGVGSGSRLEGTFYGFTKNLGNCTDWTNWPAYSQTTKDQLKSFALSSMDSFQHMFFWTWKIGNSSVTGKVEAPQWSYKLGLEQGWLPTDPRDSHGVCAAAGGSQKPFSGNFKATETGAVPTPTVDAAFQASFSDWPPVSLGTIADARYLPTYTATGTVPTLTPAAYTQRNGTKINGGSGWFNSKDDGKAPVDVQGCSYPGAWSAAASPTPTEPFCSPTAARRAVAALPTPN